MIFNKLKLFFLVTFICITNTYAQDSLLVIPLDKSPVDYSFYPEKFPFDPDTISSPKIRILYSRPQKKDRELFGAHIEYGKVWRLGANECTEITFYHNAIINGQHIPKGSYSLFAIPHKDKWTLILNKELNKWGNYLYDPEKDLIRFDVPILTSINKLEIFTIYFDDNEHGTAYMFIGWDHTYTKTEIFFE